MLRLHPDGTGYQDLHDFTGADGQFPEAPLLALGDGFLYGRTAVRVFRLHPDGTGFANVYDLTNSTIQFHRRPDRAGRWLPLRHQFRRRRPELQRKCDGIPPAPGWDRLPRSLCLQWPERATLSGALLAPGDGFLYGTTQNGGPNGTGNVFRLHPDGTSFADLHDFSVANANTGVNADGSAPNGALVVGGDGFLYGEAQAGGAGGYGTLFRLRPDGTGFADLPTSPPPTAPPPSASRSSWATGSCTARPSRAARTAPAPCTASPARRSRTCCGTTRTARPSSGTSTPWAPTPSPATYGPIADDGSGNTGWAAIALSTGPDEVSHLLWTNPDGRTCLWSVQADGSPPRSSTGRWRTTARPARSGRPCAVTTAATGDARAVDEPQRPDDPLGRGRGDGAFTIAGNYDRISDGAGGPNFDRRGPGERAGRPEPRPVGQCRRARRCCGT